MSSRRRLRAPPRRPHVLCRRRSSVAPMMPPPKINAMLGTNKSEGPPVRGKVPPLGAGGAGCICRRKREKGSIPGTAAVWTVTRCPTKGVASTGKLPIRV